MRFFIYVITRDYGFAPNPFYNVCTLATCKPGIRRSARLGDWVFGIGSKTKRPNTVIFLMKVTEKMTFNEYWESSEYAAKKPQMTTLKKMYGDNIYHRDEHNGEWYQANSHHSYSNGATNQHNLRKDTSSDKVLISRDFFYFGRSALVLPNKYATAVYRNTRNYHNDPESPLLNEFLRYVRDTYEPGYIADPTLFTGFTRYDGVSSYLGHL